MTAGWLALLALLLVAVAVVVAVRWARIARVAPAGPVERGPLPVVLVHGMFGFDQVGVRGIKLDYFRGIAAHLGSLGCPAHAVRLPSVASVPRRAQILADTINALPHDRVDIIAHSLGGLDARYAIAKLGLDKKVRALVTIGTPHRGTPLAALTTNGALGAARKLIGTIGVKLPALDWLSPSALESFNAEIADVPGVRYACVVAGIRERSSPIAIALTPLHAYLQRVAGPNDCIVPMSSQYWGETLAEIECDHWEQVGWHIGSFDALGMYAFVIAQLGAAPALRSRPYQPNAPRA